MLSHYRWTVLAIWLAVGTASAVGAELMPWAPTLGDAQKLAAEQDKLVLVHFYNDHCPPCERVEREVFAHPRVVEAISRNYVPVKVHAGAQPKIAEQFRVDRWPTDIICTPVGLEIMRTTSPQKAEAFVGLVDQVARQTGVGAARQWQTSMQAAGQQILDSQVTQAQAVAGQAAGATQGYSNQTNSTFQAYADQANRWNQQTNATAQQAAGTAQQFGNSAQQLGNTAQQTAQQFGAIAQNAGRDLRTAWNAGAAAAAPPGTQATPQDGAYAQFAQPTGAAPAPGFNPAAQPIAPPVAATPPTPSLPTTNPFISAAGPASAPPAAAPPAAAPPAAAPPASASPPPVAIAEQPAAPPPTTPSSPPPNVAANPMPMNPLGSSPSPALTPEQGLVPASQAPPTALEGYCPVTLLEQGKWKRSDPKFGAIHRGRTYLFATEAEQKKFLADPDAFSPVLSGFDPVTFSQHGQLVEGKRSYGLKYNRQIFLFADEASLQAFSKNPQAFAETARQAMHRAENGSTLR